MRPAVLTVVAVCLSGCGYMGDTLPPALNKPEVVQDIMAVERGADIVIQFTLPQVTTEDLPLKKGSRDIELRIGPPPAGAYSEAAWLRTADLVPGLHDDNPIVRVEVPAAKYKDKTVFIAVSVHGPSGRSAGFSKLVIVHVVAALPTPQALELSNAPDAVHLAWQAGVLNAATEFRVFRKLVPDVEWMQIGTSTSPSYTDNTIEYGMTYQYQVQSIQKTDDKNAAYAESERSDVRTIKPVDTFAPAVPAGLTAVPGARSIELVWTRNTEKDFGGYTVFRDGKKIADGLTAPAYSDRGAQPKVTYKYQVSAVDTAGNESNKSAAVEAAIP